MKKKILFRPGPASTVQTTMLSVLRREVLENIFDRLSSLDMLKPTCRIMHSVSGFLVKRQRQKVRTMFFDIYDRLRMELNTSPIPTYLFELRGNGAGDLDPWVRAYNNSKRLSMALLSSGSEINIFVSDVKTSANISRYMWLQHNHLMVNGDAYPFPEDPYAFVHNALDGILPVDC